MALNTVFNCKEAQPRKPKIFWCNHCDSQQVDSEDKTSGKFYIFFGHSFDQTTGEYDGEYGGVMLAICSICAE